MTDLGKWTRMAWLIVTPARNETARLPDLATSLAAQREGDIACWVVVDDGSTDGTAELAERLRVPFRMLVVRRQNSGGLGQASEFKAFCEGVDAGLLEVPDVERVMKCDADLRLSSDHLAILREVPSSVGLCGGVLTSLAELEQRTYVLGGLKAYTPAAYEVVRKLPAALGWDVLDEVAVRGAGMDVLVVPRATAWTSRRTGSSEGLLAGRRRNGVISRWVGYHPVYFSLRLVRMVFRKPFLIGALELLRGYATAGPGPHPAALRDAMRAQQAAKLRELVRHPARFIATHYGRPSAA
jgi:glycosyltransferase involved in cell wall biosynthesis